MDYYTKEEVDQKLEDLRRRTIEDTLKSLPLIVRSMVMSASKRHELSLKFYSDNPEFSKDKEMAARVIEEMDAKYPGETFENILAKSSVEIKRRLTLSPTGGHSRTHRPTVDELDSTLNGAI